MKWFKVFFLCLLSISICTGCGGNKTQDSDSTASSFAEFQDDAGRMVRLEKKPERIVVTSASFLEPLHAVGGDVVGRPDSKTMMPDYAKDKTSVGKVFQIDLEKLLECKPDLVIINQGMNEKLVDTLEINRIPSMIVKMKSFEDVKHEIQMFAQVTGAKEMGNQVIADMDGRMRKLIKSLPEEHHRVAVIHSTSQGLSIQLEGSIAGNIVKLFGWENVASGMQPMEKNPDAAPYSMETLVEQNPEIIFVTSMGNLEEIQAGMEKTIEENPAWQTIPAIQNGHLYYLPQDLFLLSPGIHYPEAAEYMARLIYPEIIE